MVNSVLKGAIFGGIVVFLWMWLSWTYIPWHATTMNKFDNESAVVSTMKRIAPKSGVYMFPSKEGKQKGALIFTSVNYKDGEPMGALNIVYGVLTQIFGALILSLLVWQTAGTYFSRLVFCTLFGFGVGVISMFPMWNWMDFSTAYVWVAIAESTAAWFLGGLLIAGFVSKPKQLPM